MGHISGNVRANTNEQRPNVRECDNDRCDIVLCGKSRWPSLFGSFSFATSYMFNTCLFCDWPHVRSFVFFSLDSIHCVHKVLHGKIGAEQEITNKKETWQWRQQQKKSAYTRRNAEKVQWNEKSVDYCLANRKTKGNVLTKFSMEMRGFFASIWFGCVFVTVRLHSILLDQVNCSGSLKLHSAAPHFHDWTLLHVFELLERCVTTISFVG